MNRFSAFLACCLLCCVASSGVSQLSEPPGSDAQPKWLQDDHMVIVVPKAHTSLAAYSVARNIWTSIDVRSQPSVEIKPALYHGLAAAKIGNVIYAYSGQTASWASLTLSDTTATFVFQGAAMNVKDGNSLYVFGINSQAWSGIDLVTGQVILSGHQAGEQPHALEPAAAPVSNGESSPPAQ